jgi:hypothetical protein
VSHLFPIAAAISAGVTVLTGGCYQSATLAAKSSLEIALQGFSERNYANLDKGLDSEVCISGKLAIDSMGVYYPLQPVEEEDVITIGFSRINTGLDRLAASRKGLTNGGVHTICGLLENSTPFKNCDTNHCKWYTLTDAKPRRRF